MDKDWRNELVTKGTAYDALANLDQYYQGLAIRTARLSKSIRLAIGISHNVV